MSWAIKQYFSSNSGVGSSGGGGPQGVDLLHLKIVEAFAYLKVVAAVFFRDHLPPRAGFTRRYKVNFYKTLPQDVF